MNIKHTDTENDQTVVFFKVFSNLGIAHVPNHQYERNDGVYYGPDAVLSTEFLNAHKYERVHEFSFTKNDELEDQEIFSLFAEESRACADQMARSLTLQSTLITVGGDNSVCFPALLSDFVRFPNKKIGIIDFDTHGDIHLQKTSPTNNIHGMYLRPFFDTFDVAVIEACVPQKLSRDDILYFGNFDFEKEESDFMDNLDIRRYSQSDIHANTKELHDTLDAFLAHHDHIHINFDIDVFDKTLVEATGIPNENGLFEPDVFPLLTRIRSHPSIAVTLSEINPEKPRSKETIVLTQKILSLFINSNSLITKHFLSLRN